MNGGQSEGLWGSLRRWLGGTGPERRPDPEPDPEPPPSAPPVGAVLNARYRLDEHLGRGAAAVVYAGHDLVLDVRVAVKVLLLDGIASGAEAAEIAADLRNEAKAAMTLAHPNIASVHTYERHAPWEFLVMEFVEGTTLHGYRIAQPKRRVEPGEVARFGAMVLDALAYAHSKGITHNDIKPSNVLLPAEGGLKVCDFGLARMVGAHQTDSNILAGTVAYMCPERIRGGRGDARSDLYSVGAMLYMLGNGQTPFGSKPRDALKGHLGDPPPTSRYLPVALDGVLKVALAKDPNQRYQGADEMREALVRAMSGKFVISGGNLGDAVEVTTTAAMGPEVLEHTERPAATRPRRRFKLLQRLGEGSTGEVHLAEMDTGTGFSRKVAIKLLHKGRSGNQLAQRLRDTTRVLGRSSYRHIVPPQDLVKMVDQWAAISDYVPGVDLSELVEALAETNDHMPYPAAFQVGAAVCSALGVAYGHGESEQFVLHLGLKPSNVRLTDFGDVKVLDFGMVDPAEAPRPQGWGGVSVYTAPERLRGEPGVHASDVYSATVILAELLLGQPMSPAQVEPDAHAEMVRTALGKLRAKFTEVGRGHQDAALDALEEGLASDPEMRPPAGALAERFARLGRRFAGPNLSKFSRRFVSKVPHILQASPPTEGAVLSGMPLSTDGNVQLSTMDPISSGTRREAVATIEDANTEDAPPPRSFQAVKPAAPKPARPSASSKRAPPLSPSLKPPAPRPGSPLPAQQRHAPAAAGSGPRRAAPQPPPVKPPAPLPGEPKRTPKRVRSSLLGRRNPDRHLNDPVAPAPPAVPTLVVPPGMAHISGRKVSVAEGAFEVGAFFMDLLPVTNEAYAEFIAATREISPAHWHGGRAPPGHDDHPVVGVTLEQAKRYAAWRRKRLPTTLEWYGVAQGVQNRAFPWGAACDFACCNCPLEGPGTTTPVGSFPKGASAEGCADLIGNVWEWTLPGPTGPRPEPGYAIVLGDSFKSRLRQPHTEVPRTSVSEHGAYLYLGFRCAQDV